MPGHADGSVTVYLGYGRDSAGRVGGSGEQQGRLQRLRAAHLATSPGSLPACRSSPTGDTYLVACTQQHHLMENRDVVRAGTLAEYREQPDFAAEREQEAASERDRRGPHSR